MNRPEQSNYWIHSKLSGDRFNAIEYLTDMEDYIYELEQQIVQLKKELGKEKAKCKSFKKYSKN